jgi:hypothetical protein
MPEKNTEKLMYVIKFEPFLKVSAYISMRGKNPSHNFIKKDKKIRFDLKRSCFFSEIAKCTTKKKYALKYIALHDKYFKVFVYLILEYLKPCRTRGSSPVCYRHESVAHTLYLDNFPSEQKNMFHLLKQS